MLLQEDQLRTIADTLYSSAVVALINQKFAENHDKPEVARVLNTLLNEIKLHMMPTESAEVH